MASKVFSVGTRLQQAIDNCRTRGRVIARIIQKVPQLTYGRRESRKRIRDATQPRFSIRQCRRLHSGLFHVCKKKAVHFIAWPRSVAHFRHVGLPHGLEGPELAFLHEIK